MKRMRHPHSNNDPGYIVILIMLFMLLLTTMIFGAILLGKENVSRAWSRLMLLQAQYSAESGADYAVTTLNNTNSSFTGTTSDIRVLSNVLYKATFAVTVTSSGSNTVIIKSTGKVYKPANATTPTYTRTIQVTAQRTPGSSASGMMSTNDVIVDSSVKNIFGSTIYLNGFLNVIKNTTKVNVSNITIAGKDTGASNCSIEGSGSLVNYPSSSKGTIDVAYNNCISPPGNTSNANWNVTANDSSVSKIQSLYIPWSQYMDSSYKNSPSGCSDWTSGASPHTIPSTGNTKKTHYPDSGSGVATSCGNSGSLDLGTGTYNIADNVHIRANLCSATPCDPTFNNTSGSLKFVFVEGSVDFTAIQTSPGSSPLVFVVYGADPGTHAQCIYGGVGGDAVYINKAGSTGTNAPQIYFLAKNDICLYQTKFDASPALGGFGGKNIFVSSNSGNPFDLNLNTSFPLGSVPINLAWKATGYERL